MGELKFFFPTTSDFWQSSLNMLPFLWWFAMPVGHKPGFRTCTHSFEALSSVSRALCSSLHQHWPRFRGGPDVWQTQASLLALPELFTAALGPLFYMSFRIFMSSSQKILLEFGWRLHLLYNLISGDFSLQPWAPPSMGRLICCRLLCGFKKVWQFSLESCYFYCEWDF